MLTVQRPYPPQPVCLTDGAETIATPFPSGHAAAVTVYAATARGSTHLPFVAVTTLATLVAVSRVYLGTHYLSDTIAGVCLGLLASLAAGRLLKRTDIAARFR